MQILGDAVIALLKVLLGGNVNLEFMMKVLDHLSI